MDRLIIYADGRQYTYRVKRIIPGDPPIYEIISEDENARLGAENERRLDGRPEGPQ
jgi:hypothetical protein